MAGRLETLDYSDIRHPEPVFHGDTIYAESTIVAKEELPNGRGVVIVESKGLNQRAEVVLTMRRKIVVPKRPEGELPWPN